MGRQLGDGFAQLLRLLTRRGRFVGFLVQAWLTDGATNYQY